MKESKRVKWVKRERERDCVRKEVDIKVWYLKTGTSTKIMFVIMSCYQISNNHTLGLRDQ